MPKPLPPIRVYGQDLEDLKKSGLTDKTIRAADLYTVSPADDTTLARLLNQLPEHPPKEVPEFCRFGGLVFPYRNLAGEVNGFARVKPHRPREPGGKLIKYEQPKGESLRAYYAPASLPLLCDGTSPVHITEGEKKALALSQLGLAAVGLGGVDGWQKKGTQELIDGLAAIPWKDRAVYITFDYDPKAQTRRNNATAARKLARALRKAGAKEVYWVEVPPGPDGAKQGADDFLVARGHGGGPAYHALVKEARPVAPAPPCIHLTTHEHEVNEQAVAALATDPTLYQRGGVLVHVVRAECNEEAGGLRRLAGTPRIIPVPPPLLRERLTAVAEFTRHDGRAEEDRPTHPPAWCVGAVHARGDWPGLRHLTGVVEAPVLRPDGTILDTPGYDPATGLLYLPGGPGVKLPQDPTKADVKAAVAVLLDLVCDFPFAKGIHKAAWVAYLLTALARYAFDGPAPMTVFDGNVPGAGKGLLCALVSVIATGLDAPVGAAHSDDAEMRKAITAAAIAGDRLVLLDNVTGLLGGAALEAVLTATRWRDRLLGTNQMVDLPMFAVWAATGNNVMLGNDGAARRVMQVRLESPEEFPEDRKDFRHRDVRGHARRHRAALLAAALTVLRGYCAAGRPDMDLTPWGSFEAWSALVRNAVVWAGLDDPGKTRDALRDAPAPETAAVPALLAGIATLDPKGKGMTVGEILAESELHTGYPAVQALHEALCVLCPSKDGKVNPRSLGMKLHHLCGRVVDGRCLQRLDRCNHAAGTKWLVVGGVATTATTATTSGPAKIPKPPAVATTATTPSPARKKPIRRGSHARFLAGAESSCRSRRSCHTAPGDPASEASPSPPGLTELLAEHLPEPAAEEGGRP
jgi:Domain of unknown function (DUF3854)